MAHGAHLAQWSWIFPAQGRFRLDRGCHFARGGNCSATILRRSWTQLPGSRPSFDCAAQPDRIGGLQQEAVVGGSPILSGIGLRPRRDFIGRTVMQEREYLGPREHPHYCTCVECQTKRTSPAPTKLSSSEKKRRRKARQKAAKSGTESIDSQLGDNYGDAATQADQSEADTALGSLLDQANEIVKQTPGPGPKKKKKRRKRK